jgi:hypothetical protein
MSSFLAVAIVHSCIAIAPAIMVSASDVADDDNDAFAISGAALAAIAASLARFANVAITPCVLRLVCCRCLPSLFLSERLRFYCCELPA